MNATQASFIVVGTVYLALPLVAWGVLHGRHDRITVALWCGGGLLTGLGLLLIGMRGLVPGWASLLLANTAAFGGYALRVAALRRELQLPLRSGLLFSVWLAAYFAYALLYLEYPFDGPRALVAAIAHGIGGAALAWLAHRLYEAQRSRSAAMIAAAYLLLTVAAIVRAGAISSDIERVNTLTMGPDFAAIFVAGLITALFGNVGFIGVALDAASRKERAQAELLAREQEQRLQADLRLREQSALLDERGRLLAARDEMIATLAHEVRQPLHNATAVLQGAAHALEDATAPAEAGRRLHRAADVLGQVVSLLDNTLADAALLDPAQRAARQDTEVALLLDLVLSELGPAERARVRRVGGVAARTASMNPGLVRLALRNLLANALAYSPPGSPVTLRVGDSDHPLALLIEVGDQGPGLPDGAEERLFERGVRGRCNEGPPGHGLGLYIVRRVMQMHGGEVRVSSEAGRGAVFTLVIPQGLGD